MCKQGLILATGATGAVGPRVVHALDQAGFRIRSLSIDEPETAMFPQGIEVLIGDVTDHEAVQSAMQDVDAVVHMAAILHIVNPSPALHKKYERVNIGGTEAVVKAAIKAGVKRIVLFSTIAVYGTSDGRVLNEMSPTHPETFYAQTKFAAEQIILNARGLDGQPLGTVLRLGAVYGARIKGNYERLTHALAHKYFIPIGDGLNRRTLIYDKDVGRAVVQAVSHPSAAGRLYNVTDGFFHTMNEIVESICSALQRKPPQFSLPLEPMQIIAGFIEKGANAISIKSPVTRETVNKYTEDIAVDGKLIQQELGFIPQYNLKAGWDETIQDMKKNNSFKL